MSKESQHIYFIDTSEEEAVIAVFLDSKKLIEKRWLAARDLSKTLDEKNQALFLESGLTKDDIGGVAIFPGPGSFTGLRIGVSFGNALAFGLGVPLFEATKEGEFDWQKKKSLITPMYGRDPHITKPRQR
jgi:tRNA threonylcarbamoyladenosine biosynthesis protein TsaB